MYIKFCQQNQKKNGYKLYSNITCPDITCNPNSTILIMLFFGFPISPYPIQPYAASIGYTKAYAKPSQSNLLSAYAKPSQSNLLSCYIKTIKPYVGEKCNHTKIESLRAASLSKLDNVVNSSSVFNTKCAEFSTKWQVYSFIQPLT